MAGHIGRPRVGCALALFASTLALRCAARPPCLPDHSDYVPPGGRRDLHLGEGPVPVGFWVLNWDSSLFATHTAMILAEEIIGYNTNITGGGDSSASGLYATAGCTEPNNFATDPLCTAGPRFVHHAAFEVWGMGKVNAMNQRLAHIEHVIPEDAGDLGYNGVEGQYVYNQILEEAYTERGLALEYYKSYNSSWTNAKSYFNNYTDFPSADLRDCSNTRLTDSVEMTNYVRQTGDTDGVVDDGNGNLVARCWFGSWWLSPSCRAAPDTCIPSITGPSGWGAHELMQRATIYNMPVAIAAADNAGLYRSLGGTRRSLLYWWQPDSSFIDQQPQILHYPPNNAVEWKRGRWTSMASNTRLSKWIYNRLKVVASRMRAFIMALNIDMDSMNKMLYKKKVNASKSYEEIACKWIRDNPDLWAGWIPDTRSCIVGSGLFNVSNGSFVRHLDNATGCEVCAAGRYSEVYEGAETFFCAACPEGRAQAAKGETACRHCEPGTFAANTQERECSRCGLGRYQNESLSTSCMDCAGPMVTRLLGARGSLDCVCPEGMYMPGSVRWTSEASTGPPCLTCPSGLECGVNSSEAAALGATGPAAAGAGPAPLLKPGHYSEPAYPLSAYRCQPPSACESGPAGQMHCAGSREGFLCATCPSGHFPVSTGCQECRAWDSIASVLFLVFCSVVLFAILLASATDPVTQRAHSAECFLGMGQLVVFFQVLMAFGATGLKWGDPLKHLLGALSIMNFDVDIIRISCVSISEPVWQYVTVMCGPVVMLLLLTVAWAVARRVLPGRLDPQCLVSTVGHVLTLVFIPLTLTTFAPFECYSHPSGQESLLAYPQVLCWESATHSAMVATSVIGILVYPVPILTIAVYANYRYPRDIVKDSLKFIRSFRFLFFRWQPEHYWFSLVLLLRGFFLAFFPRVMPSDRLDVIATLMNLTLFLYALLTVAYLPWRTRELSLMDCCGAVALTVAMMVGAMGAYGDEVSMGASVLLTVVVTACTILGASRVVYLGQKSFCSNGKDFAVFLSHHKGGGACGARFLKMALGGMVQGQVFFDSDNLASFDGIFSAVKLSKCVVVILSGETLCRTWCVGEIVTAYMCGIPMIPVVLCGPEHERGQVDKWQSLPSDDFGKLCDGFELLRPHGICTQDVGPAVEELLAKAPIYIDLATTASLEQALEEVVAQVGLEPGARKSLAKSLGVSTRMTKKKSVDAVQVSEALLMSDSGDVEAMAAGRVLKRMMQMMMQQQITLDGNLSAKELREALACPECTSVLWLITNGSLCSESQLARLTLARRSRARAQVIPVVVGESFAFPSEIFYQEMAMGMAPGFRAGALERIQAVAGDSVSWEEVSQALKSVFKSIASFVNVPYANEVVLAQQVRSIVERMRAGAKEAKRHASEPREEAEEAQGGPEGSGQNPRMVFVEAPADGGLEHDGANVVRQRI